MNIYRESIHSMQVDIHVGRGAIHASRKLPKSEAQAGAEAAREEAERSRRKPGEPLNYALPMTLAWAARLPPELRPHELIRVYARIANHLALGWDDTEATHAVFRHLVSSPRANRRGFPQQIRAEILALQWHYVQRFPYMTSEREHFRSRLAAWRGPRGSVQESVGAAQA